MESSFDTDVNLHVSDNVGGSTSCTWIPRESAYKQEYGLRKCQNFVWYFGELDPESERWDILGIFTIEWKTIPWMRNDFAAWQSHQAVESKGTFLLWFCSLSWQKSWPSSFDGTLWRKIEWFMKSREYRELNGIDGEPVEFEWSVFPGYTILGLLRENRRKLTKDRITLEEFKDRIIFMSMCNGIDWTTGGNLEMCISNCSQVKANAKCFPKDIGQSPHRDRRKMVWNAHLQARRFVEPLCRYDNASTPRTWTVSFEQQVRVDRGTLKSKKGGTLRSTAELWFRTILSVNQLSVYGAISDWCEGLAQQISDHSLCSTEKPWRICLKSQIIDSRPMSCRSQRIHLRPTFRHRETSCEVIAKDSKHFPDASDSSWRNRWFCEKGLFWTIYRGKPWHGWWISKCWSIPRIFVTSKWCRFCTRKVAHYWKSRSRTIGINMELKSKLNPWRMMDLNRGWWFADGWTNTLTNWTKKMENLLTMRQNTRGNQIHRYCKSQRCSCQLTNGSGKIFLPPTASTRDPCHTESRRQWPGYYDIMVLIEKMMEQLIGIHRYLCYVETMRTPRNGRIWNGLGLLRTARNKNIFQCAEIWRFHPLHARHPRSLWRNQGWSIIAGYFRTCGVSACSTLALLSVCILISNQDWLRVEKIPKKEDKQYSSRQWIMWAIRKTRIPRRVKTTKGTLQEQVESVPGCQKLDQSVKGSR